MWKLLLTFGASVVVGAVGSYLAGMNEGRKQALQEFDEENKAMCAVCTDAMDESTGNPA